MSILIRSREADPCRIAEAGPPAYHGRTLIADLNTLAKVGIVFTLVVWTMKRRFPMGAALAAGGLAIALAMGRRPAWIANELLLGPEATIFAPHTGQFVAVMGMIVALSYVLQRSGQIDRLTRAFQTCFRNPRVTLATLPAIIGLLPMPGGALFSAPMVEAGAAGTAMDKEDMTLVNYWYRHVWEYAWPLYPGVLFSAQLMRIEPRKVALAQSPLVLAAIVGGFWFLTRARAALVPASASRRAAAKDAAIVLMPFAMVFALHLIGGLSLALSVAAGLVAASLWTLGTRAIGVGTLLKTIFANAGVLDMMAMGFGAKIFGDLMIRSDAIAGISSLFQGMGLPLVLLAVALPAAVGFFSGMTIVYVMTTFPVLLAFPGVTENPIPVIALGYAAGYCGTILSPVHSCLVMSARYFQSDLTVLIRRLMPACAAILAMGAGLYWFWGRVRL